MGLKNKLTFKEKGGTNNSSKICQFNYHIVPSQDLQAPRYILACPLPTNSPKDFSCFDLQLNVIIPMIHMHLIFP